MLTPPSCPIPATSPKNVVDKSTMSDVRKKVKKIRAERQAETEYIRTSEDAAVTKQKTVNTNLVTKRQKKVDDVKLKIQSLTSPELRAQEKLILSKEQTYDSVLIAQTRVRDQATQLRQNLAKANPTLDANVANAYIKLVNTITNITDPLVLKSAKAQLKTLENSMNAQQKAAVSVFAKTQKGLDTTVAQLGRDALKAKNQVDTQYKAYGTILQRVDKRLADDLDSAQKTLDGAKLAQDSYLTIAARAEDRRLKKINDTIEAEAVNNEYMQLMSDGLALHGKTRGVLDWTVSKMGLTQFAADATSIRRSLQESQRVAENLVNMVAQVLSIEKLTALSKDFRKAADALGIDPKTRRVLMTETIEKGQIPRLLEFYTPSNTYLKDVNLRRYQEYRESMLRANFTEAQIDDFINQAVDVSESFNKVRLAARAMNVSVETVEPFIGYVTRLFSSDALRFIKSINPEVVPSSVLSAEDTLKVRFDISRKYDYLVPTDIDLTAQVLNITPPEVMTLLDNPLQFLRFLEESVEKSQLDMLVKMGLFDKLPMSSADVFEYLKAQYPLPFNSAADMIVMEPTKLIKEYGEALSRESSNAMIINAIINEEGMQLGWSVSPSVRNANLAEYANFVSLGEKLNEWASRVNIGAAQKKALDNIYVHPIVSDQIVAIMDIGSSPVKLNALAEGIAYVHKAFSRQILVGSFPVYILNQVRSGYFIMHAMGANFLGFVPAMVDLTKVVNSGLTTLDDVVPVYVIGGKEYTERGFFKQFYLQEGSQASSMFSGVGKVDGVDVKDATIEMFQNASSGVYQMLMYTFATGALTGGKKLNSLERFTRGLSYFFEKSGNFINAVEAPVFWTSNLIDMSVKYAAYRSLARKINPSASESAAKYLFTQSVQTFDTIQDIYKHVNKYMPSMRDVGTWNGGLNKYLIPFFSWSSTMMPRVLEDVVRRPWRYAAYDRIRQFSTEKCANNHSITEAGLTAQQLSNVMYGIDCDENDQLILWSAASYDPFAQLVDLVSGFTSDSASSKRASLRGEPELSTNMMKLMNSTFPYAKTIFELTSNKSLLTGKALQYDEMRTVSVLGMEMTPLQYSIFKAIPLSSYALATDRTNPFGISGTPEVKDANGESILVQGTEGLFGGTSSGGTQKMLRDKVMSENFALRIIGVVGSNLRVVDMVKNNKISYNDIERTSSMVSDKFDKLTQTVLTRERLGGVKMTAEEESRLSELQTARVQLQIDSDRVYLWLRERGKLTDKEIAQKDKLLNLAAQKGLHPLDISIQNAARQMYEWNMKMLDEVKK